MSLVERNGTMGLFTAGASVITDQSFSVSHKVTLLSNKKICSSFQLAFCFARSVYLTQLHIHQDKIQ